MTTVLKSKATLRHDSGETREIVETVSRIDSDKDREER